MRAAGGPARKMFDDAGWGACIPMAAMHLCGGAREEECASGGGREEGREREREMEGERGGVGGWGGRDRREEERIFIGLMTSDRRLKASERAQNEGSTGPTRLDNTRCRKGEGEIGGRNRVWPMAWIPSRAATSAGVNTSEPVPIVQLDGGRERESNTHIYVYLSIYIYLSLSLSLYIYLYI